MDNILIYPTGSTAACRYAAQFLQKQNIPLVDHPTPEVTHLLLDIPSFGSDGKLRSGGALEPLLEMLPPNITVIGGHLSHPALEHHRTVDLLMDAHYLSVNAAITADCALQVATPLLTTTLQDSPALVIGWGRIGKCLAQMLKALRCNVTVAARKEADRAMLRALQYEAVDMEQMVRTLPKYRLIFNTAPESVLSAGQLRKCSAVKIDLASRRGLESGDVVWARGLPGIHAPESSGKLIAETILSII